MLVGDDYVLFEYHHDPDISYFEFGTYVYLKMRKNTFPRNDTVYKGWRF